jgi:CRISPR-associated protein Csb1
MPLDLKSLRSAVAEHAAFRRRQRLQPVGGVGDKIFPPTYPGERNADPPRHVFEKRRIEEVDVWTALLDSVQSSSNRSEEALLEEARSGRIELPYLSVSFLKTAVPEVGEITSLDAPHPISDESFSLQEWITRHPSSKRLRTRCFLGLGTAPAKVVVSARSSHAAL